MPIQVTCDCGNVMKISDSSAGLSVKCPVCGRAVGAHLSDQTIGLETPELLPAAEATLDPIAGPPEEYDFAEANTAHSPIVAPLQYVSSGQSTGGPIAPPPSDEIRVPTSVPSKLRRPNCPPLYLIISTVGADVQVDFDASPVLTTFVEIFTKQLKRKYDVRLGPVPPGETAALTFVRVMTLQQGNRWLRYFLGLIAMLFNAGTHFEVEGNVQVPGTALMPLKFKHRCHMGVLGGGSLALLKLDAKIVAKKVAAKVRKAR